MSHDDQQQVAEEIDPIDEFGETYRYLTDLENWAYLERQFNALGFYTVNGRNTGLSKAICEVRQGLASLRRAIDQVSGLHQSAVARRQQDHEQSDAIASIARRLGR